MSQVYVNSNIWDTLTARGGVLYINPDGNETMKAVSGAEQKTPDLVCYDLRREVTQMTTFGKVGLFTKLFMGVVITLFLIVLVIGVFAGWLGYESTNDKGETRYDIFFGEGFYASNGGAFWWGVLMLFSAWVLGTKTYEKWFSYNLSTNDDIYVGTLAGSLQSTKNKLDSYLLW